MRTVLLLVMLHACVVRGFSTPNITKGTSLEVLDAVVNVGKAMFTNVAVTSAAQTSIESNRSGNLLTVV